MGSSRRDRRPTAVHIRRRVPEIVKKPIYRALASATAGLAILLPTATPSYGGDPAREAAAGQVTAPLVAQEAGVLASCSGSGCNGRDPSAQGCGSDAHALGGTRYFNVRNNQAYMSIQVRASNSCRASWARVTIDNWLGGYGPPYRRNLQIRIERQIGNNLCHVVEGESSAAGDASTLNCQTWWNTHSYSRTLDCCSATGNYWTAMAQRTGGMERHRECYRFRYSRPTTGGGQEFYWDSWSCSSWR